MARWYSFSVARLSAHPSRAERLNVGLVVFNEDRLDVRPARNLEKIRAISAAVDVQAVRMSMLRLDQLDRIVQSEGHLELGDRFAALQTISPLELSQLGRFECRSTDSYEQAVAGILMRLVEPEPAKIIKPIRRSHLLSSLKAALKNERVLAKKGDDLSSHRVVPSWQLAEGLSADLVLKNGAMHVIETVDAQSDEISVRKLVSDIAVSALVLEQARMIFGDQATKARLVYSASASNEAIAKPSLRAAEHQGTELINWASHDARLKFITEISQLAVPFEPRPARVVHGINASIQPKLLLN